MKKGTFTKCGVLVFLCSLLMGTFLVGCGFNIGGWGKAKFKRTQNASAPLAPGLNVSVETNYGSITVNGADVSDCNVIAKITAQAPTQQEAQQIAEQVKIELEQVGDILNIKAKKPDLKNNRSICISYEITVPMRTSVDCESSYGSLKIANIIGDVRAETSYGSVNCDNLQGSAQLETSYGKINCRGINAPKISARSSYGSINIEYSASAAPQTEADVVTSYGGIDFAAPHGFEGTVEIRTSYGSIKTELPITVKGEIGKRKLKGTIGEGNGKLHLRTSYGSIKLK